MRKHLSYANIVATLALLFAMSGGALAANHYLLNSVTQINPKVLRKLRAGVLYAEINSEGSDIASSPGVTSIRQDTGLYDVNFGLDIEQCAIVVAEANLPGHWPSGYLPESAQGSSYAWVARAGGEPVGIHGFPSGKTAQVATSERGGASANSAFSVIVTC